MIGYSQLLGNGFSEFDSVAEKITSAFNETAKSFDKAIDKLANLPMNIIKYEDGSEVIEVAAVGLTKDNIKLTIKPDNGSSYLYIKIVTPEKTEEEKAAEQNKEYLCRKIKTLSGELPRIWLAPTLDLKATTRTLENGLLTIRIPAKEEVAPVELTID